MKILRGKVKLNKNGGEQILSLPDLDDYEELDAPIPVDLPVEQTEPLEEVSQKTSNDSYRAMYDSPLATMVREWEKIGIKSIAFPIQYENLKYDPSKNYHTYNENIKKNP